MKPKKNKTVKGSDLPARLKEAGIEIDAEYVNYIPHAYQCREGLFKDGKIPEVWRYNLDWTIKFFNDIKEYDLPARLKERSYELDLSKQKYIPYEYQNGKYGYDLEKVIDFLNSITRYNLPEKLKERGYEINDEYLYDIMLHCSSYSGKSFSYYELEKVVAYINSPNDYNLPAKLKERGYEISTSTMTRISNQYSLSNYVNGFSCYDLDKVIEFLDAHPQKNKILSMQNLINEDNSQQNGQSLDFYGKNPKDFFKEAENFSSRFPISKWYAEKYKTIPDICFIGQIYIDELLNDEDHKVRWFHKHFTEYENINSSNDSHVLRAFENEQRREIISEALIEIEDGMFILLTDGRFERENETMYGTALLFYKEGIHDTTDILLYVSDKYVVHSESGKLGLLFHDRNGFDTHDFTIPRPQIDFNLHYNKGFEKVHNSIISALYQEKGKGLVLLHGKPGTGKTTYIRYLINLLNKNKIFVPPNLTELLSDPGFIPFLMNNPNCILFVEDAENVLRSREDNQNNQAVSNILNITDGLLSDCLNIQIVATFNTNLRNIDEALLRKGRLIAQYEFTELANDRAEKLAGSLKVWLDNTNHITLADIYASVAKTT